MWTLRTNSIEQGLQVLQLALFAGDVVLVAVEVLVLEVERLAAVVVRDLLAGGLVPGAGDTHAVGVLLVHCCAVLVLHDGDGT